MKRPKKLNLNDFTIPSSPTEVPNKGGSDGDTLDSDKLSLIEQTGSITVENNGHYIHCLTIIGQIEGHYILSSQNKTTKYEHVIPRLVAIEENPEIEGLIVILNTVGGDIEAGLAIAELLAGMETPVVSLVLGGGHSIGVPLAVSSDHSFIAPSATMTIHPVRMNGLVLGVPQAFSYFNKMQDRIIKFIDKNSNISSDRFRELMMETDELATDVGTVLDGEAAVKEGLIDSVGSLSEALDCLYDLIEKHPKQKRSEKYKKKNELELKDEDKSKEMKNKEDK